MVPIDNKRQIHYHELYQEVAHLKQPVLFILRTGSNCWPNFCIAGMWVAGVAWIGGLNWNHNWE